MLISLLITLTLSFFSTEEANAFNVIGENPRQAQRAPHVHRKEIPGHLSLVYSSSSSSLLASSNEIPYNEGDITVTRRTNNKFSEDGMEVPSVEESLAPSAAADEQDEKSYKLSYRIYRPMALSSRKAAPILVLHGGPGVPSNYLYPLVNAIEYRTIIFHDQIGCGNSDVPANIDEYSIDLAIDDLQRLIKKLNLRRFHLYGQSFGGILAFEYLKRIAEQKGEKDTNVDNNDDDYGYEDDDDEGCLSVIISSSPTSVEVVEDEVGNILSKIKAKESLTDEEVGDAFFTTHQCRCSSGKDAMPQPLKDAYDNNAGTIWRGTDVIKDYVATPPSDGAVRMPSALIMRGEYDFVTDECVSDWSTVFNHKFVRQKTLEGCSHFGLLENGRYYGDIVDSFFAEYD